MSIARLSAAVSEISSIVEALDVLALESSDALALVSAFVKGENLCAAGKALCAARAAGTGAHRRAGHADPASWLASVSGEPRGRAQDALQTASTLQSLPKLDEVMRTGQLSPTQARTVADAASKDPGSESSLLDTALTGSLRRLRDEAERVKAAARSKEDDEARYEAIRKGRYFRSFTGSDGAFKGQFSLTPDAGAKMLSILQPASDFFFDEARRQGRHESSEAYLADALVAVVTDEWPGVEPVASGSNESGRGLGCGAGVDHGGDSAAGVGFGGLAAGVGFGGGSVAGVGAGVGCGGGLSCGAGAGSGLGAGLAAGTGQLFGVGFGSAPDDFGAGCGPVPDGLGVGGGSGDCVSDMSDPSDCRGDGDPYSDAAADQAGANRGGSSPPKRRRRTKPPGAVVICRVDLTALRRGDVQKGEMCEIPGVGPVPVSVARELFGDCFLKFVITDGVDIQAVVHYGRYPRAHQRTALQFRDPCCVVPGCGRTFGLEYDHTDPWSTGGATSLDNLARLCGPHHALKTHRGYQLRGGPGHWEWVAPAPRSGGSRVDPGEQDDSPPPGPP